MFLYPHLQFEREKIKKIAKEDFILDVGGGVRFGKWLKKYESFFNQESYKTFDYDPSTSPDVVGDIHEIPLETGSIGAVICYSVLEHVENPVKALSEIHRILRPKGKLLFYVPSTYPYHASPGHYPDHWRFFKDTLEYMFKDWSHFEIEKVGGYFYALSFFFPMQHKLRKLLNPIAAMLDILFKTTKKRTTTSGFIVYAEK